MHEALWIISSGTSVELESDIREREHLPERVVEFRTSDIGHYLLSPRPITVPGTLIGCEVHFRNSLPAKAKRLVQRWTRRKTAEPGANEATIEEWLTGSAVDLQRVSDPALSAHLGSIFESLRPYHPILQKLAALDLDGVTDLVGITEDLTGVKARLVLKGGIADKRNFLIEQMLRTVPVTLRNAYLAEGLFELRGYHFPDYQPIRSHRLIRYTDEGQGRAVLLNAQNRIDVHVTDMKRLRYVRIFEQAVKTDPEMAERLQQCLKGELIPLKLFFNDRLEIAYSDAQLPGTFHRLFTEQDVSPAVRDRVVHSLKRGQIGISLSYLPVKSPEKNRTYATVSVMHDIRVFDSLKQTDPTVYREIQSRAGIRDNVPYYLLDSITGVSDETSV